MQQYTTPLTSFPRRNRYKTEEEEEVKISETRNLTFFFKWKQSKNNYCCIVTQFTLIVIIFQFNFTSSILIASQLNHLFFHSISIEYHSIYVRHTEFVWKMLNDVFSFFSSSFLCVCVRVLQGNQHLIDS